MGLKFTKPQECAIMATIYGIPTLVIYALTRYATPIFGLPEQVSQAILAIGIVVIIKECLELYSPHNERFARQF